MNETQVSMPDRDAEVMGLKFLSTESKEFFRRCRSNYPNASTIQVLSFMVWQEDGKVLDLKG